MIKNIFRDCIKKIYNPSIPYSLNHLIKKAFILKWIKVQRFRDWRSSKETKGVINKNFKVILEAEVIFSYEFLFNPFPAFVIYHLPLLPTITELWLEDYCTSNFINDGNTPRKGNTWDYFRPSISTNRLKQINQHI